MTSILPPVDKTFAPSVDGSVQKKQQDSLQRAENKMQNLMNYADMLDELPPKQREQEDDANRLLRAPPYNNDGSELPLDSYFTPDSFTNDRVQIKVDALERMPQQDTVQSFKPIFTSANSQAASSGADEKELERLRQFESVIKSRQEKRKKWHRDYMREYQRRKKAERDDLASQQRAEIKSLREELQQLRGQDEISTTVSAETSFEPIPDQHSLTHLLDGIKNIVDQYADLEQKLDYLIEAADNNKLEGTRIILQNKATGDTKIYEAHSEEDYRNILQKFADTNFRLLKQLQPLETDCEMIMEDLSSTH